MKSPNSIRSDRGLEVSLSLGPDPFLMGRIACENVTSPFQVTKHEINDMKNMGTNPDQLSVLKWISQISS